MRILLVEPHKSTLSIGGEDIHCYEPLALEYLAPVCRTTTTYASSTYG